MYESQELRGASLMPPRHCFVFYILHIIRYEASRRKIKREKKDEAPSLNNACAVRHEFMVDRFQWVFRIWITFYTMKFSLIFGFVRFDGLKIVIEQKIKYLFFDCWILTFIEILVERWRRILKRLDVIIRKTRGSRVRVPLKARFSLISNEKNTKWLHYTISITELWQIFFLL